MNNIKSIYQTLIFVRRDNHILLGLKKRGFGEGKFNGFGGKLEKTEHGFEGVIRELKEESTLTVSKDDLMYLGAIEFREQGLENRIVYIFTTRNACGVPLETEEMKPEWFHVKNIPYEQMFPDSPLWMPLVLGEYEFRATFEYKNNNLIKGDIRNITKYVV